jgi:5-formyltetrahydrofolate cyclo-ligase
MQLGFRTFLPSVLQSSSLTKIHPSQSTLWLGTNINHRSRSRHRCITNRTMSNNHSIDESIRSRKQILRKEIRSKLKQFSIEDITLGSQQVWDQIYDLPVYQNAKHVGFFLSMPKCEISTHSILNHAIQAGKYVYVPQVGANFEHIDMELLQCPQVSNFYDTWPKNKWLIPEPPSSMDWILAQPGDLDLIVVPGLAFDCMGGRLGQGKGYYDRFLAKFMSHDTKRPILVGVGLSPQLVTSVPIIDDLDIRMDWIVVPNQVICCNSKRTNKQR